MGRLSTKHAVLGLMIDRPSYGYNLQQQIAERLGFLGLAESTVYKTLERLEQDGWVEEVGQKQVGGTRRGAPRILYRATPDGVASWKSSRASASGSWQRWHVLRSANSPPPTSSGNWQRATWSTTSRRAGWRVSSTGSTGSVR